ncbi:MAG: biliverdin-producing heme oxygenase [Paracoccus sp. (in: a-proteobacteria)]|uniref:biliverdin-producing heme oxygenase n=1 Tax=Paracoccus sp. TaxID=267 RepID=UPI0039E66B64
MRQNSLRHSLMNRTRDLHRRLDQGLGEFAAPQDYHAYLRGSFAFRTALEAVLPLAQGWPMLALSQSLRADLGDLDLDPPEPPRAPELAATHSALAGALYVIEGSALGARVLQRRAQALGFGPDHGARHLDLQTRDRARWPQFLAWLESQPADEDQAVASANAVFALALAAHGLDLPT